MERDTRKNHTRRWLLEPYDGGCDILIAKGAQTSSPLRLAASTVTFVRVSGYDLEDRLWVSPGSFEGT
jgi:hypothetical protein